MQSKQESDCDIPTVLGSWQNLALAVPTPATWTHLSGITQLHIVSAFYVSWAWVNHVVCQVTTLKARSSGSQTTMRYTPVKSVPPYFSLRSSDCFERSSPTCASFHTDQVFPHNRSLPANSLVAQVTLTVCSQPEP